MYDRILDTPASSVFLFGPRGTGKTTFVRQRLPNAHSYDLLDSETFLRLSQAPQRLYDECRLLACGSWVVIDEVQRIPTLLNEVHRLIEGEGLRFVLTGSSARKLRRGGVNLLAGRALGKAMFPLVSSELGEDANMMQMLRFGSLPSVVGHVKPMDYLHSYTSTYLAQEVQQEALTRNLGAFSRFLEVAARQNAQQTNMLNIAREAGVKRSTVAHYFEILEDTLLGNFLPAWKLKSRTRQVKASKFYFFDCGVTRSLSGRLPYPPSQEELGPLLEALVVNELRAYISYQNLYYPLHYWSSYSGSEVDVLLETQDGHVAIEIKASHRWDRKFHRALKSVAEDLGRSSTATYGVYMGAQQVLVDDVRVLPVQDFLKALWRGELIR